MKVLKNTKLADYTTLKIGGIVKNLHIIETIKELEFFLKGNTKKFKILGGGSNILADDTNKILAFDVIKLAGDFEKIHISDKKIVAGSAVNLTFFLNELAKNSLEGMEIFAGIPGNIGGATHGNISTKYGKISNFIKSINQIESVIVDVEFDIKKFKKNDPKKIKKNLQKILKEKIQTQPYGKNSAGCVFKNLENKNALAVGKIIDELGLKGTKKGNVYISDKHANFFIAEDGANFADFITLVQDVKQIVKNKTNIDLDLEIEVWE